MKKLDRPIEKKVYAYFEKNGFDVFQIRHYMAHTLFVIGKDDITREIKLATGKVDFNSFIEYFEDYWNTISR